MALDMKYFEEMEAKIQRGRSAPGLPPLPPAICTWQSAHRPLHLAHRPAPSGTFILRIEDTDQTRQVEGATEVIYRTLAECGLDHDEGPDVGGPVAPYIQTQRRDTYGKYARLLVEKVIAYKNSSQDIINAYMAVAKIPDEHTGTIILKIA